MSKDKCPFEELMIRVTDPRGFLEPGQKIGNCEDALIQKGGLKALFAPGTNYQDFKDGRFEKHLLVVEPDSDLRLGVIDALQDTAFTAFGASTYEDAMCVLDARRAGFFDYALIASNVPRSRGDSPELLGDELYDRVTEGAPETRVFSLAGQGEPVGRDYAGTFERPESIRNMCIKLIEDAETIHEE